MARRVNIPRDVLIQGVDVALDFPVYEGTGTTPAVLTGLALAWYLWDSQTASTVAAATPKITKTTTGGAITVVAINGAADGARVQISDEDTVQQAAPHAQLIPPGLYYHELWRTDEGNERLLAFGDAPLSASPRRQVP